MVWDREFEGGNLLFLYFFFGEGGRARRGETLD